MAWMNKNPKVAPKKMLQRNLLKLPYASDIQVIFLLLFEDSL